MKRILMGLSLAVALAISATSTQAATVTVVDTTDAWQNVNLTTTLSTGAGGVWTLAPTIRQGNIDGVTRSPFDPSGGTTPPTDWEDIDYYAVGPGTLPNGNPNNPSLLSFATDQKSFSFLWGSVDTYNTLEFLLNNVVIATVLSAHLVGADAGVGAAFVSITDLIFDQVRFLSANQAFEFSSITTSPVPIPPALLLFGSGLAGLIFLARRRRQSTGPGLPA